MARSVSGSTASCGSGRSKQRSTYKTVATTAAVDESLFASRTSTAPSSGDLIQVLTKDSIRKLRAHRPEHMQKSFESQSVILSKKEYRRIAAEARIITKKEEIKTHYEFKETKNAAQEASAARKYKMQYHEKERRANEKLSELEQEALDRNNYLKAKAQQQIDEEEDEIKRMNELMLYAKCVAIRDAQVREKKVIERERNMEEKRLDTMMEIERIKALEEYERRERVREEELRKGADVIRHQINEREQARLMEMELKDQETRAMLQHLDSLKKEDVEEQQRKKDSQKKMMEEVERSNEEMVDLKRQDYNREKAEDLKIQDYLKDKEKREQEYIDEQARLAAEREREIARLYKIQEKSQDLQSERDALRAKRALEEYERNWRNKERDDARKHFEQTENLIDTRNRQVREKQQCMAIQAQRDRKEFERVINVQKSIANEEKEKRDEEHRMRMAHAQEVREQIREKETERFHERQEFFAEGERNKAESAEKLAKLTIIRERKLNELRNAGVPEKYCAEVERRMRMGQQSFSASIH